MEALLRMNYQRVKEHQNEIKKWKENISKMQGGIFILGQLLEELPAPPVLTKVPLIEKPAEDAKG